MFTATLVAMLIANAAFAASRRAHVAAKIHSACLRILHCRIRALFRRDAKPCPRQSRYGLAARFFVWVSVFNLFNTAIFWAFMTDLFTVEQGKRLYGFIAVGGSLGAILGAYITKYYVREIGPANLLVIAAVMFAIAAISCSLLSPRFR